jgi:glycosyltransferase involved in cell wall biosynthesis
MTHRLSISVIIPVHNRCQFLSEALDSVLCQQYEPLEILVVDDGSTDNVRNWLFKYSGRVEYMRQEHRGPGAARSAGVRRAQGDLIAFLDNDDLFTPSHLNRLGGCIEADPDVQIAQGQLRNFRDEEGTKFWCSPAYYLSSLPSAIYRRKLFESVGIDESLRFGEDLDFFIRCWEHNIKKVTVDHLSLLYRRHGDNMTHNRNLRELGLVAVYRRRRDRIEQKLWRPLAAPCEPMRDYLGTGMPAYDDGTRERVDEALFGYHLPRRGNATGDFGNHTRL